MLISGSGSTPPPASRLWWLAVIGLFAGLLTVMVGLGLGAIGMGFVNATACGTGLAGVFLGVWTVFATRGLWRRRAITLVGLSLAWGWLLVRILSDMPATVSSGIVAVFVSPSLSVTLLIIWLLLSLFLVTSLWLYALRMFRKQAPRESRDAGQLSKRELLGLVVRVGLLVLLTAWMPKLVWLDRAKKIQQLKAEYGAQKGPSERPRLGACTMVFLGYELTEHGAESAKSVSARQAIFESTLADAKAELASIVACGAASVRVGVSGDQLLISKPDQEPLDDRFMEAVRQSGLALVLVDTQHPKALQKRKLGWDEFCQFQRKRIEYYEQRYQPAVYFVVCEPLTYHQFCLTKQTKYSAGAWVVQLSDVCRLVKSINPATRTGICLLVGKDREAEWQVWSKMKTLPELDILSVEIYEPENFHQTQERLALYGHPKDYNKSFWIAETYNGWALCPSRDWERDAAWLSLSRDFGQVTRAEEVLVWSFGTFVEGGSFWDFTRSGRFSTRWANGQKLSRVGEAFAELAGKRFNF